LYDRAYSFLMIMDEFLKTIIKEAGQIAKPYFYRGVEIQTKADSKDYVTAADIAVSKYLVEKIHEKYPDHHIKSEEMPEDMNPENDAYEWVIDPIDGTRNFAIGIPVWAIMIALLKNGETHMAAVYHPIAEELFFAEKSKGAFLNDKKITVNNTDTLEKGYGILFRCPPYGLYGDYFEKYKAAVSNFALQSTVAMGNFGCAGMLTYVAKGSIDFALGNGGLDWDLLPTLFICQEAGAVVTNSHGEPWTRGRQDYVISNATLHSKVLSYVNSGETVK
jgi:myo-inositol-1(or 4)-monophosphatase